MNTLYEYKKEINALCADHKVRTLYAFGSALTPNFNSKSDIDLIVDFKEIKQLATSYTGSNYNACLLNLYHDGEEGMGWHSDDEKEIIPNSSIASLSFGAERKFAIKHKGTKETHSILLESGSLFEMLGSFQKHWLHSMPKSKKIIAPRINLTFRQMHS